MKDTQFVSLYNNPKIAKSNIVPRIYPIPTFTRESATAPIPMIHK